MLIKKHFIKIVFITLTTFITTQNVDLWTQKITIENSFRDKINFAISRLIDSSQFFVNVDIELNETRNQNLNEYKNDGSGDAPGYLAESESTSPDFSNNNEEEEVAQTTTTYSPIPGLPAIPSPGQPKEEKKEEDINKNTKKNISLETPTQTYLETTTSTIKSLNVTIYLEEAIATANNTREITEIICGIIPKTDTCSDCTDCINFKQMEFNTENQSNEKVNDLESRLLSLEQANDEQRNFSIKPDIKYHFSNFVDFSINYTYSGDYSLQNKWRYERGGGFSVIIKLRG